MKILFHTPTHTLRAYPRQDDLPVVGLESDYQVFDVIHNEPPNYDEATQMLQSSDILDIQAKKVTRGWLIVNKPQEAKSVTMGALRLALGRDLCIAVGAWIQGIQDATQKFQAQTWWEYSPTVRSNHPVVEQFRVALNKTPEEVAAYFSAAYAIDNP